MDLSDQGQFLLKYLASTFNVKADIFAKYMSTDDAKKKFYEFFEGGYGRILFFSLTSSSALQVKNKFESMSKEKACFFLKCSEEPIDNGDFKGRTIFGDISTEIMSTFAEFLCGVRIFISYNFFIKIIIPVFETSYGCGDGSLGLASDFKLSTHILNQKCRFFNGKICGHMELPMPSCDFLLQNE